MKELISSRKAQATIFIIIGIILLIGVTLAVVFRNEITQIIPGGAQRVAAEVPLEFQQVSGFVTACLYSTSIDGIKIIGEHGGYVNPIASGKYIAANPTEGNAANLISGIDMTIPYWYYLDSPNDCSANCRFSFGMLYLRKSEGSPSIESELESYITANLPACLNNLEAMKDAGYVINEIGNPVPKVTITPTEILVSLDYPMSLSLQQSTYDISTFFTTIGLNMERVYSLAKRLTEYEAEYHYLEKHMANLIVGYSGLDKGIPPMADVTIEFGSGTTWQKDRVEQNLIMIMESNIPLFQVENTRNYQLRNMQSEALNGLYNRGTNIPNNFSTEDLNVYYNYYSSPLGWEPYFDLNCRGNECAPMSASSNVAALIGIQRYKFFYDLSYPVLVEINSPDELTNEVQNGFRFKFFLESNLRDNAPLKTEYERQSQIDLGRTLFCDEDKRNSGNITINVSDAINGKPLDSVSIAYTCGADSCVIGTTDSNGYLKARFPICFGGIISFIKQDYSQLSVPFNVNLDQSKEVKASLAPNIERKISLKKKILAKSGEKWILGNNLYPLSQNEEAFIIFNRIGGPADTPYSAFVALNSTTSDAAVSLAPGKYSVEATIILNERVEIPKSWKGIVEIPGVSLTESPSGGLSLNMTFTPEQLAKNEITIIALGINPRDFEGIEDMEILGKTDIYSREYQNELQPIFS